MPRWLWWSPLVLATLMLALFAFRAGWRVATLTETDVITGFASQYEQETGGALTDCVAIPGRAPEVWITVLCTDAAGTARAYHANRYGAQVFPEFSAGVPQT